MGGNFGQRETMRTRRCCLLRLDVTPLLRFLLLLLLLLSSLVSFGMVRATSSDEQGDASIESKANEAFPSHITVTSWNDMPFSGITQENGVWVGKGYAFYILDILKAELNFTYSIVPADKDILGDTTTGVLSLLYQRKVDIIVAFIPTLDELQNFYTFGTTLDELHLTVMMKRPQESASGSGLLAPFDRTVWLLVVTSVLVVGPTIYIFVLIRSKLWNGTKTESYNLPAYMWFVYSALLKQGSTVIARTDSTRILFATWWIFILILTSFYTANLTAFLTKPQFTLPIKSIDDIVNKNCKWVTFKGRVIEYLLLQRHQTEVSLLKKITKQAEFIEAYKDPVKKIFRTVDNEKLYLGEKHYLQTLLFKNYLNKTRSGLVHKKRCAYVIMPGSILHKSRAFAFPQNSSIVEPVNKVLLSLIQAGLVKHLKENDLPLAEICPVDLQSTERQLRNTDLWLTYQVVIAGYGISIIIFIFEIVLKFVERRAEKKNIKSEGLDLSCCTNKRRPKQNPQVPQLPIYTVNDSLHNQNSDILKRSPPPMYQNIGTNSILRKPHNINGREYYVIIDSTGDQRLIPIRTPSAFLFQYAA